MHVRRQHVADVVRGRRRKRAVTAAVRRAPLDHGALAAAVRGRPDHRPHVHRAARAEGRVRNVHGQQVGVERRLRRAVQVLEPGLERRPVAGAPGRERPVGGGVDEQELGQRSHPRIAPRHVLGLVEVRGLQLWRDPAERVRRLRLVPVLGQVDRKRAADPVGREDAIKPALEGVQVRQRHEPDLGCAESHIGREVERVRVVRVARRVEQRRGRRRRTPSGSPDRPAPWPARRSRADSRSSRSTELG